jgi:hypothetical protein
VGDVQPLVSHNSLDVLLESLRRPVLLRFIAGPATGYTIPVYVAQFVVITVNSVVHEIPPIRVAPFLILGGSATVVT